MMSNTTSTTTLVLGATGNTGKRVVQQLLEKKQNVRVIVRSKERLLKEVSDNPCLTIVEASLLDMSDDELKSSVKDCDAIVSCLGHNMTFSGIYGHPRKLVTDATKLMCRIIKESSQKTKFILMNTVGCENPDGGDDKRTLMERTVLGLLRLCVPPVSDNEDAVEYLSKGVGKDDPFVKWVAVRPDDLLEGEVSEYEVLHKPKAGLFGANFTTRANVAHFICDLILNQDIWGKWSCQMPVPLNVEKQA